LKTLVKLGNLDEPIVALVDHGLEINFMSKKLYEQEKWPIDIDHNWLIRAANNLQEDFYGACPNVSIMIGNVKNEQNVFIQESSISSLGNHLLQPRGWKRRLWTMDQHMLGSGVRMGGRV
jgi:hypothetical protein